MNGGKMTTAERQDYAAKLKREMNCCQAVVRAFADTVSLDEATLTSLAAGFGSGMGTMEGSCGALVGAVMVSSLVSPEGAAMKNSRAIMPRFKELCGGATICRDLKGIDTGKVLCSCENCVRNAVRAFEYRG
jgi:C_GCAxxG_C_C family probable redox protein